MNRARIALLTLACLTGLSACKRKAVDVAPELDPITDGPQPELVVQAGSHHLVADVGFSPDGRWLAVASVDGLLKVFEVRTGKEWRTYSGAAGPIYNVSWTPDGRRIAAGGLDKTVHVWDVATGVEVATLPGHTQWVGKVEFSPDGQRIASAAKFGDLVVAVWDVETKALRHALTHTKPIADVAWSADGKTLLTAGQELVVWNTENGGRLGEVPIDSTGAKGTALAFSPDGSLVAIAGAGDLVHVYDPRTWAEVHKLPATALVAWHRDGTLIVQSGAEVVRVDPRSGQRVGAYSSPELAGAALSADSRLGARYDEMDVYLFDVATGAQLRKIESTFWKHVQGVIGNATPLLQVAWSPTAPIVAMAGFDGVLRVIDLRRGVTPRSIQIAEPRPPPPPGEEKFLGHTWSRISIITGLAFTGDGAHLLASDGERLSQWDVRSLTRVREYAAPGGASAFSLAPDGKSLAIGHGNAVISIYDTTTGQLLRRSEGGGLDADCQKGVQTMSARAELAGLGWSIDGSKLYVVHASSATFAELDAKTFALVKGGCAHRNVVNQVAWSDGRDKVAIAGGLHMLAQMNGETGRGENSVNMFATAGDMPRLHTLQGHKLAVMAADFSPNGNLLATGGADRTARLWDVHTGAALSTLAGHDGEVSGVAFSHDNRFLATSSYDLSVKVWDVAADPKKPSEVATIVSIGPDASVIETPDHYYTATRAGFASVSFRLGDTVVPVELFDLRLNRPDIVLRRFGYAPADLLALYEKAHAKRLKKMGLTEDALRPEYHLPTVRFTGDIPLLTGERTLKVPVRAEDTRYKLDRLQVYVNDVPVHGTAGIDLRKARTQTDERTLEIDLLPGRNKIQVAALNAAGTESAKATVDVVSSAPARPGTLYVVSVGVSRYADVRLNLKYAAKDAKDIAGLFQGRGKKFNKVEVVQILDDEAVRENILAARKRLAASTVDDQVVVFVAGHGMLDQALDYYFVTHDFDRDKPPKRGLSYDQLESLLDGIPARRKLMMMDTCHSGEVDDEAMRAPPPPPGTSGVKMTADFRTFSYGGEIQSPDRSGEVLAHLFADLRRGAGAAVISSASGAEFALESARWQNGVFTYAVLQGLTSGDADRYIDGTVQVSELRDYVVDEVHRLTRGAQTPTARRENLEFDFSVF